MSPTVTTRSGAHFFTSAATSASGCPSQPKSPITAKRVDTKLLEDELGNDDESDEDLSVDDELGNEELIADDELRTEDDRSEELTDDDKLRTEDDNREELTADDELRAEDDTPEELTTDDENRDELLADDESLDDELELIDEFELIDILELIDELELIDGLELIDELDETGGELEARPKATEELLRVSAEEDAPGPGSGTTLALCDAMEDKLAGDELKIEVFASEALDSRDERVTAEDRLNTELELAFVRLAELILLLVGAVPPDPPQPTRIEKAKQ